MNLASQNMTSENLKDVHENADDEDCKLKHSYKARADRPSEIQTSSPNDRILRMVEDVGDALYSGSVSQCLEVDTIIKINTTQLKPVFCALDLEESYNNTNSKTQTMEDSADCSLNDKFVQEVPLDSINYMESQKLSLSNLEDSIQKDAIKRSSDTSEVRQKRIESKVSIKTNLSAVQRNPEIMDCSPSCEAKISCPAGLLDQSLHAMNEDKLIQDTSRRISVEVPGLDTKIDQTVPFVKSEPKFEQFEKDVSCEEYSNFPDAKFLAKETLKAAETNTKSRFVKSELLSLGCKEELDEKFDKKDEFHLPSDHLDEKTSVKGINMFGEDKMVMIKSETDFGDIIEKDTMKCLKNIETEYENDILDIKKEVNMICKENDAYSGPDVSCVKEEIDVLENEILGESDRHFADGNIAKIRNSLQEEVLLKTENEDCYEDSSTFNESTIQIEIESVKNEMVEESSPLSSRILPSTGGSPLPHEALAARPPIMLYQPSTPSSALVMQIVPMNLLPGTQPNFLPVLNTSEETILPTTVSFGAHGNRFITHTIRAGQSEGEVITDSVGLSDTSRMDSLMIQEDAYGLLEPKLLTKFINFKCSHCGKTYMKRKPYENHLRDHIITTSKVMKCIQTKTEKRLQAAKAMATRFRIPLEKQTDEFLESISKKGKFYCKYCNKCYLFFGQAKRHEGFCEAISTNDKDLSDSELYSDGEVEPEAQTPKEYDCVCGRKYFRRSRLETCLRSHDSAQVTCGMCRKLFPTKVDYQKHRREVHFKPQEKPPQSQPRITTMVYKCKFCPAMFDTQGALIKHLKMHKKKQLEQLQEISKRLSIKKDKACFVCAEKFTTDIFLREHLENSHLPPYVCNVCSFSCNTIPNYHEHAKQFHEDRDMKAIEDALRVSKDNSTHWTCSVCSESFTDSNKFLAHTRSHRKRANADRKISITKFRFHCQHCEETFPTLGALTSHRGLEHGTHIIQPFQKIVAEEPLAVATVQAVVTDVDKEDKRMCVHCRKICRNMEALAMHMRFHSMERVYPCKYCDFRFSSSEKLKKHELIHTGTLKYVCFVCEYRCASQNKLVCHKQSLKHDETKKALLESWPNFDKDLLEVISKKNLEISVESDEIVSVTDVSGDTVFSCDLCNEKFSSEHSMSKHKLATHPFIEFPDDKSQRIFFK